MFFNREPKPSLSDVLLHFKEGIVMALDNGVKHMDYIVEHERELAKLRDRIEKLEDRKMVSGFEQKIDEHIKNMNHGLFQISNFTSSAGLDLDWRVECDALTDDDWAALAHMAAPLLIPFDRVIGVPTGGEKLAKLMEKYKVPGANTTLIVDDVLTTGASMASAAKAHSHNCIGLVAFARTKPAPWITPIWSFYT